MQFKTGDEIIISRGTYRNQTAIVAEVSEAKEQYAVKLQDGTLTVVNAKNIRQPYEVHISASDLADVLSTFLSGDTYSEILTALEAKVPGITSRVAWPAA